LFHRGLTNHLWLDPPPPPKKFKSQKNSTLLEFLESDKENVNREGGGLEVKTSRRSSLGGLDTDEDFLGLDQDITDEELWGLDLNSSVRSLDQVVGTDVGQPSLTVREGSTSAAMSSDPVKPFPWVTALLARHGIQTPTYNLAYYAQARQSGRQWPLPEDGLPNTAAAGVIYPPVAMCVDSVGAYRRGVEKLRTRAKVFVWHQLRGMYQLGHLQENPGSKLASGMESAKRGIWSESTWAVVALNLADHLTNDPRSSGDCWYTDIALKGGSSRGKVTPQHTGGGDAGLSGAYPLMSVTFGSYHDGGPRQGVRFVGEKLLSKEDPKVYIGTHRIAWTLGHPTEVAVRSAGDRTSQADHSCRDHVRCFNPWHIPTGTDKANKSRKACRNGYARHCPCKPSCWFTDEVTGHYYECLNNETLLLRDIVMCSHSPNCCDYFDRVKFESELPG
jgi:hypothetical protein